MAAAASIAANGDELFECTRLVQSPGPEESPIIGQCQPLIAVNIAEIAAIAAPAQRPTRELSYSDPQSRVWRTAHHAKAVTTSWVGHYFGSPVVYRAPSEVSPPSGRTGLVGTHHSAGRARNCR
jgi:hypothetical protein